MILFDEFDIKAGTTSDVFKLGKRLLFHKKMSAFRLTDKGLVGRCDSMVEGSFVVALTRVEKNLSSYCNCGHPGGFCEHVVALGLYYLESISAKKSRYVSDLETDDADTIQLPIPEFLNQQTLEDKIGLVLQFNPGQTTVSAYFFDRQTTQVLGQSFFNLVNHDAFFAAFSDPVITPIINQLIKDFGHRFFCPFEVTPIDGVVPHISTLIKHWLVTNPHFEPFEIYPEPLKLRMKFTRMRDDIIMNFDWLAPAHKLTLSIKSGTLVGGQTYLLIDRVLYPFAIPTLPQFSQTVAGQDGAKLDAKKFKTFIETKRQHLEHSGVEMALDPELETLEIVPIEPRLVLHLKSMRDDICAKISFRYGLRDVSPEEKRQYVYMEKTKSFCQRDPATEEKWLKKLSEMGFQTKRKGLMISSSNTKYKLHKFVMQNFDQLIIIGQDTLNKLALSKEKIRPDIIVKRHQNGVELDFEIHFHVGKTNVDASEMFVSPGTLRQFVSYETSVHELQFYKEIQWLLTRSKLASESPLKGCIHLSLLAMQYSKIKGCLDVKPAIATLIEKIASQGLDLDDDFPGPAGDVSLHPYQREGIRWLRMCFSHRLGGILADDMGLGKTLQTLTFLNSIYAENTKLPPSLIVMPTTLLFNWENEIRRFFPAMSFLVYTGTNREKLRSEFSSSQLVFCSYGVLRRDIEILKSIPFATVVLDEAQVIKNASSKINMAVRRLAAMSRFALTGTPIENRLTEIWSIFQFLIPGFFAGFTQFKNEYDLPFQKGDMGSIQQLRDLIRPFILRRIKEKVALELPQKTESYIYCDLSENQTLHYMAALEETRHAISKTINELGIENAQIHIFSLLTKLRQICCHPQILLPEDPTCSSQKFDMVQDMIRQVVSGNHKIVVFSQFVRMLDLFETWLKQENIGYEVLTGQTKNKKQAVDRFNGDPTVGVFLISLRAGGTGINLTSADYVFHYDPWWNPAVENQATDRVHRIGQDKPVFVYKFVTKSTVEDKILAIQAKKSKLYAHLIDTLPGKAHFLTKEDIEELFHYNPSPSIEH